MAKELYHGSLTKHDEWTAVTRTTAAGTTTLAAAGDAIQNYIKEQFDTKIGYLYSYTSASGSSSQYWGFADEECSYNYLLWSNDKTNPDYAKYSNLRICAFDAPAPFTASINVLYDEAGGGETVSTILSSQTNNYIYFKFAIKDSGGTETNENVSATITFTNNGAVKTYTGTFSGGKIASLLVDDYISTGTNTVNITITGTSAEVSTKTSFDITVVELTISSTFAFYNPIAKGTEQLGIPFNLIGAGTKYVEWYIDGECVNDGKSSPILSANYAQTQQLSIYTLESGKHNLQIRPYESVNNNKFYGDTLYFDFVITGKQEINILLSGKMSNGKLVGTEADMISALYIDGYQYEKNSIEVATYDPVKRDLTLDISLNDKVVTSLATTNETSKTWEYTPSSYGELKIELATSATQYNDTMSADANFVYNIAQSNLNISEYIGGIIAKFDAKGRSNDESNKDTWTYTTAGGKTYSATFNNVKWNDLSGWKDDALILSNGATVTFDFNPFSAVTDNGFTFEIEFETADIKSDDVKIMKFGDTGYKSYIEILGTSATMNSDLGTSVTTNYKDNERMKLAFVINSKTSTDAHNLIWIINNGVLERSAAYANNDSFRAAPDENTFTIGNPDGDVTTKIYSIRIFQTALTTQQEFSNWAIDSEDIAGNVTNNDVFESDDTTVSIEKVRNKVPVMLFTGDMDELRGYTDKKTPVMFDITYTNPDDPTRNFIIHNAYVTKQGTSSLKYPCPNFRLYTQKDDSTTLQLPNLPGFEDVVFTKGKMYYEDARGNKRHPQTDQITDGKITYSFKDGALPVKCWTIKADFAESSMSHNTGVARWFNNMNKEVNITNTVNEVTGSAQLCKTAAQAAVEEKNVKYHDAVIDKDMETYPFDIRTTVDGFPICVFYRVAETSENTDDTKITFMGLFNFNNDKSSTDVFGFKTIKMYEPDEVDENGNALTLKQTKIFKGDNVFCWEGSANEEEIGKFISTKFDMGAEDANGNPLYDYDLVDSRNIFAAYETRYPDEDDVELADGNTVAGDMFNNTASLESLVRWINYTQGALDLRVYKTDGVSYEDGYTLQSFTEATEEEIADAKESGKKTLYVKTSDDSEGTTATYESTTYYDGAIWKTIEVEENGKKVEKYVDEDGNVLENQTDESQFVNINTFYTKRSDIDFEHVDKHVWTADEDGHKITDYIYTGWVMNWQGKAIQQLEGTLVKGGTAFAAKDYMTFDDYSKHTCSDHNVEVFLTRSSDGKYTYVDGYGKTQTYVENALAVEGQAGYVKTYDYRGKSLMDFFSGEYSSHFDIYKLASYFIYTKRFGTVDQMVKNIMLTTEDGKHWYYIHYDNDTINGVRNDSLIKYKWDVTRETYDLSINAYAYAGFQSVLWNNLENCSAFMTVVRSLDSAMAKLPTKNGNVNALKYDGAIYWFDTMQVDQWCERLYNSSEDFKYISPYIKSTGNSAYLAFLQGNRKSHRHWWLRHRFDLIDSEWVSGEYANFYIGCYTPAAKSGEEICTFTAASDFYFGWMTNTDIRESATYVKSGEQYTFKTPTNLSIGDPVRILAPYQISEITFENCSGQLGGNMFNIDGDGEAGAGAYINTRGTQLKKLIIGNYTTGEHIKNVVVEQISSLNLASQLQWLNIQNCSHLKQNIDIHSCGNLHIYECEASATTAFYPANGAVLYKVELPSVTTSVSSQNVVSRVDGSSITDITLQGVTFDFDFKFDYNPNGINDGYFKYTPDKNLKTITIENVTGDFDSYEFVKTWYNAIKNEESLSTYSLTLKGINWGPAIAGISKEAGRKGVDPEILIGLKEKGLNSVNIQGYVYLSGMTYAQYKKLTTLYGENVFNASGTLVFDAPSTQFLFTDIADEDTVVDVTSGSTIKFSTVVFPLDDNDDISFRMYVNDSQIDTKDANGNYVSGNFTLNPKYIDNGKLYGVLNIAEQETNSVCKIAAYVVHDGKVTVTSIANRIQVNAKGVTMPKGFTLTGGATPLVLESKDSETYNINVTVNNAENDAAIKSVNFQIVEVNTDGTVKSGAVPVTGDDDVHGTYVSAKWDKEANTITIYREEIPTADIKYNVIVTPKFNTTREINAPYSKTITVTAVSVIPAKFELVFDTTLNTGVVYDVRTEAQYNADKSLTHDIIGIINSSKKLVGFKVRKPGTYHIGMKYLTATGVESKAGVQMPAITAIEFDSWDIDVKNINIEGFDMVVNESTLENPSKVTGSDLPVLFGSADGGNGILVKIGDNEKRIYLNDVPANIANIDTSYYKIGVGLFITYPTTVNIIGDTTVNLNNKQSRTVNYTYDIKSSYTNDSGVVDISDITMPYTITTAVKSPVTSDVLSISEVTNAGFTLTFGGKDTVGSAKYYIVTETISNNLRKSFNTTFTINYTAADANGASDMELNKFYLVDTNCSLYKVDGKADTDVTSSSYNTLRASLVEDCPEIIGVAYKWNYESSTYTNDDENTDEHVFAISLKDLSGSSLYPYIKMGNYNVVDRNAAMFYQYSGYEHTKELVNNSEFDKLENKNSYYVYQAWHAFDEYSAIQGYIGDYGEYIFVITQLFTRLNNIIHEYEGEQIAAWESGNYNRYWTVTKFSHYAPCYIWVDKSDTSGSYLQNWQTDVSTDNKYLCRPCILIK